MLGVSLFGSLRVRLNGKDFRLAGRPKVGLLLAYLLLNCRQPVSRNSVAFALWPDAAEDAARSNLRRHLKYLRDALPDASVAWILADRRTVQWNPAALVAVDATEFERRCADRASLQSAVDLYDGLLSGSYDDWVVAARERFHRSYIAAVWELALQARGRGDSALASRYLRRILDEDPWREDALRALMATYHETGDRSSALQACANFERKLRSEMDVALMAETVALRRAIERGDSLPTVPLRTAAPMQRTASRELPFGGRDAEMAKLERAWERALAGAGGFALVAGEAGIGKTRLASEFALRLEGRGRVLWGTTSPPERAPYQAITEVIRAALNFVDLSTLDDPQRARLSLLVPEAGDTNRPEDSLSIAQRAKVFDAVAHLLRKLADERPTLIVLEDLHHAGPATLAIVEHLKDTCSESPLFIIALARSSDATAASDFGRLRRSARAAKPLVISLAPISLEAAAAIVKHSKMLTGRDAEARRLTSVTAGHPLFLTELLNARAESDGGDAPLTERLHDAIAERLARLTPESRSLLDAAAVVGTAFDLEIVGEVVGWSEAQLADAADELVSRRIIRETPHAGFAFEFAHELIATAAYEALDGAHKRRWHRRAARAASHWYASRLEELSAFVARHYDLGGEREAAARTYLAAARAAAAVFANDESLAYAARGLELAGEAGVLRFDLLALREEVCERIGDRTVQRIVLDELAEVARTIGEPCRVLEALRRRESLHRYVGEFAQARTAIEELRRLAAGDALWEAIALRDEAVLLFDTGSQNDAHDAAARAADRATEAGDVRVLVSALTLHAHVAATLGRIREAKASIANARRAAERDGSVLLRMRVAYCEMSVRMQAQEDEQVVATAPQVFELAERVSDREVAAGAHMNVGGALVRLFRVAPARHHLKLAIELYRDSDLTNAALALNNLATLELDVGRLDRVDRVVEAMEGVVRRSDAAFQRECLELVRCDVALRRSHYGAALQRAEILATQAAARQSALLEGEARRCAGVALKALGRVPEAIGALERSQELLHRIGAGDSLARVGAEFALACALGGDVRAATLAGEAFRRLAGSASAIPPAAFWTVAQAFDAAGYADEYRAALRRAHEQFVTQARTLRAAADRAAFAALPANAELLRAYNSGAFVESHSAR